MKSPLLRRRRTSTEFVQLDTKLCKACWKCIESCPNGVIGRVDLPWHKHAVIAEPEECTGCLNCVSMCEHSAYSESRPRGANEATHIVRKRTLIGFLVNNVLLVAGLAVMQSGLALQLGFHMGGPDGHPIGAHSVRPQSVQYEELRGIETNKTVGGLNYSDWSTTHKYAVLIFSVLMACHTILHWKWYKGVITKHLLGRNREVMTLSVLFILAAFTGLVPWIIDLSGGAGTSRMHFIEIHDKLTLVLIVFLVLHFVRRAQWFPVAYAKLRGRTSDYHLGQKS